MRKKNWLLAISLALVLAIVGLTGCTSEQSPSPTHSEPGNLEDITWVLESYGEPESLQTVLEGTEITALFDSATSQISGSAGANHYSGVYQISKDKLSIQEITHTEMYRLDPEGVMEQEDYYLKALQAAESYEISVGKLSITTDTKVLIFKDSEE